MSRVPRAAILAAGLLILSGCSLFRVKTGESGLPDTPGAPVNAPSYGYFPIDPVSVNVEPQPAEGPVLTIGELLSAMPNETVRIAVGKVDTSGKVSFGPIAVGAAGNSYVVIVDYIKFQTSSIPVDIHDDRQGLTLLRAGTQEAETIVPVYLGVGLRLRADLAVISGNVDLSNLAALGVAAQANKVTGTLVVQTLGVTGPSMTTLLPLPSDINTSTITAAIVSLGAMKAKLYDSGTQITPQAVGVYNTIGGSDAINDFVSSLLANPTAMKVKRTPVATSAP